MRHAATPAGEGGNSAAATGILYLAFLESLGNPGFPGKVRVGEGGGLCPATCTPLWAVAAQNPKPDQTPQHRTGKSP